MLFGVNVPGSFIIRNLDGRLFIVDFFWEFRITNTSLQDPQGEGEQISKT